MVRTAVNGVATDLLVDTSGGLSHVVAEVDSSGAVAVLYVRAGDMLLEEIRGGVAKMYEADGLGSVRSLLDTSGAQTDTWSYEAFGTTLSSTGTSATPYRFAGERFVGDVGMYQNRARWLDTRVGRFVSVDPAEGDEEEPVTVHPYLYGRGGPTEFVDPTGKFFTGIAEALVVVSIQAQLSAIPQSLLTEKSSGKKALLLYNDISARRLNRARFEEGLLAAIREGVGGDRILPDVAIGRVTRNQQMVFPLLLWQGIDQVVYYGHAGRIRGTSTRGLIPGGRRDKIPLSGAAVGSLLSRSTKSFFAIGCDTYNFARDLHAARPDVRAWGTLQDHNLYDWVNPENSGDVHVWTSPLKEPLSSWRLSPPASHLVLEPHPGEL